MKKIITILAFIGASVSEAAWADVTVSPRLSYYFDNANQRKSALDSASTPSADEIAAENEKIKSSFGSDSSVSYEVTGAGATANQLAVPMFGLSATVGSDRLSFTLTGMYGKGRTTVQTTSTLVRTGILNGITATDNLQIFSSGISNFKRYDIELTAQRRLNERFALIGGVRYERVDATAVINSSETASNNIANLAQTLLGQDIGFQIFKADGILTRRNSSEVFSVRGGISGYIPFSQRGTVFLTGMVHVSHESSGKAAVTAPDPVSGKPVTTSVPAPGETTVGPDFAVGMQQAISENIAFDIRYRAAVYLPVSGGRSFKDPRVNHGVNLGVSFRF